MNFIFIFLFLYLGNLCIKYVTIYGCLLPFGNEIVQIVSTNHENMDMQS